MAADRYRVYGARVIVMRLCCSLKCHGQCMMGIQIAGWSFVNGRIDGLGEILEH